MAYRNGTYVAFDGMDTPSPIEGDIKYFNLLKSWKSKSIDFNFSDSHKKTYQVKGNSTKETLKKRLLDRLRLSKNMILILTDNTRSDREMLNYEIEKAIDLKLPIVVCYADYLSPIYKPENLSYYWVNALRKGIEDRTAQCIHIPFRKAPIFDAVSQFSLHSKKKLTPLNFYSKEAYQNWDLE